MRLVVREAAAADVEQAFLWYERQRTGLGGQFLAAVESALDEVAAAPGRFPIIHRNTRRTLLRRFPYGIFFRVHEDTVIVVACFHGHRDPLRWQRRR